MKSDAPMQEKNKKRFLLGVFPDMMLLLVLDGSFGLCCLDTGELTKPAACTEEGERPFEEAVSTPFHQLDFLHVLDCITEFLS